MILYIIYLICSPCLWLVMIILSIFNSKIRNNYFSYFRILNKIKIFLKNNDKEILLFHAASSGEFEQLKPILRLINKEKYCVIQSFTSSTIFQNNQDNHLFDMKCYQPFDFFLASYLFFKSIHPTKYIITRHDLWPNHLTIAKFLGVKIYFINANIHKNSIWYNNFLISLTKFLFNKIDHLHVPSNRIFNNIKNKNIYVGNMSVSPDSRIAQVQFRSKNNLMALPKSISKENTIIFGSIDTHDEDMIISALLSLYPPSKVDIKKTKKYYILVPHEPTNRNIKLLYQKLDKVNLKYSVLNSNNENLHNIIIVNQIGILANLYKFASRAYVGGGFSRGVHSVLEPAIYDCNIAFGPNIEMLDEAQKLIDEKYAHIITSANELKHFLKAKFENKKNNLFTNKKIAQEILEQILYSND